MPSIKAPRGTHDILPEESIKWQYVENIAKQVASKYGCKEIRFPTFEDTGLFQRGVGSTTDIVQKEMYTFNDRGDRSITLRPEGTASVVRVCSEHALFTNTLPLKLFYDITAFRYEKPQAGRFREFNQFGVEFFGPALPSADTELIMLAKDLLSRLGISPKLYINSIGCENCRKKYHNELRKFFSSNIDKMCETCKTRLERNPMRILDCKNPDCIKITSKAPVISDYLCEDCREHYDSLKMYLKENDIDFEEDPRLVRGLDYYTRTVFEFKDQQTGLAVLAGGRYDYLVKEIDDKYDVPGLGFAMGIERIISIMENSNSFPHFNTSPKLFIASMGENGSKEAVRLSNSLRSKGIYVEFDTMGRSFKAQMKYADKSNSEYLIVIGDNEVQTGIVNLKNMQSGEQQTIELSKIESLLI